MGCEPGIPPCTLSYEWDVAKDGVPGYASGTSLPALFDALCDHLSHSYEVTLSAWCDGIKCEDCPIWLNVTCNYTQWWAQYYNDPNPPQYGTPEYYNYAPSFPGQPVYSHAEDYENGLNHDWGSGGPGNGVNNDFFLARWTGRFCFDAGTYTFTAKADDGIRVYVGGNPVINEWHLPSPSPATYTSTPTSLTAGWHTIEVDFFDRTIYAVCQVSWEK